MTASCSFEPIKKSHAIGEFIVYFEAVERLFHNNTEAALAKKVIEPHFSRVDEAANFEISFDINGSKTEQRREGYSFVKFREGTEELSWVLRMTGNNLSLHSIDYTRWDAIFPQVIQYLEIVFAAIQKPVSFLGFGMKVVDRFKYVGETFEAYDVQELLDRESCYLTSHVFSSGHRWHVNTGWFGEPPVGDSGEELLNQLNIDSSVYPDPEGGLAAYVAIDHAATLADVGKTIGVPLTRIVSTDGDFIETVRKTLKFLHVKNKDVIYDLLNKSVADRMNLVLEKA